jgi:glycerol-3-phosphate dehydrogenase (NAD(P)+)
VAAIAVFGAGAAGTALAIHLARKGQDVALWGSTFDAAVLDALRADRSHPALPERLPESARVLGPEELDEAARGTEIAVMAANSAGARSLARMVAPALGSETEIAVSIAKGLEPESLKRMTEVYGEELGDREVVALSGPSLATEVAEGWPTAVMCAGTTVEAAERVAEAFRSDAFLTETTDDVIGLEICGTAKNVAAIAAGILEGLAQTRQRDMKNARAALFTRAVHEMADLIAAHGGRRETAMGLGGVGDLLVTSLGGRNRLYGEAIGLGGGPAGTLEEMTSRGLTVEGAQAAAEVRALAERVGLELPIHEAVYLVVHQDAPADTVLGALR